MIDKWLIVGGAHFVVAGVLLKLLGWILPNSITYYYTCIANFLLFLYVARFTFGITKKWYLNERVQPENKAVFITGCDTGFGHLLAKRLDSIGYSVFASCYDENGSGAMELRRSCSNRMQIIQVDVTKEDTIKKAVDYVKSNLGIAATEKATLVNQIFDQPWISRVQEPRELWAIVNNAGVLKGFEVELTDMQDFKDIFEVNTFGPVRVTKAFLPLLRRSKGRIVNITSQAGRIAMPYSTPYAMSKHAAVAFTECLKQEMDVWDIRVISIEPESYKTGLTNPEILSKNFDAMLSKLDPDVREDYGEKYLRDFKSQVLSVATGTSSAKVEKVVEALEKAVSLRWPDSVYEPFRNVFYQAIYYLPKRIPTSIVHAAIKLFLIVGGFPKPREAENYL